MQPAPSENDGVLFDRFGRPVTGVRISLNPSSLCNFNCIFCHSEGIFEEPKDMMTASEIQRITRILIRFGIRVVKITGGEPMLRRDVLDIIQKLGELHLKELSMTTNGTRLVELAADLKARGLNRVNISLHSLREERFNFITKTAKFDYTLKAISRAVEVGLTPVKLNVVVMKGVNEDEVEDFIDYAASLGGGEKAKVQFIELVQEGSADSTFYRTFHVDLTTLEQRFKSRAVEERVRQLHLRHQYLLPNGVWVEVVKPMHNSAFCMANNRIRITYNGQFKPCLLREDNHVDFLTAMRNGADDEDLAELFKKAVWLREPFFKPKEFPCYVRQEAYSTRPLS
ncbi:MAG: GTP 3',8-cyclase MoaA [Nitrososphaerales archaeon]